MPALRLWWQFARQSQGRGVDLLAVVAFTAAAACFYTVLGGVQAFLGRPDPSGTYQVAASIAGILVGVPILTLGAAAARLSVTRRNARLAAIRLAGGTRGQTTLIALLDTGAQAVVGALLGVLAYALLLPVMTLLPFQRTGFSVAEMWLGPARIAALAAAMVLLALASAAISLIAVSVSPLGVAQRASPRAMSVLRLVAAVVVLGLWSVVMQQPSVMLMLFFLAICIGIVNLVGPFVLWLVGKVAAGRASTAAKLVAARRLIDDPRAAWRMVSGVAFAIYIAGVLSVAPAMASWSTDAETAQLFSDIGLGAWVTLGFTSVLAAVSAAVTQTCRLWDQAESYRGLRLAGTDVKVLRQIRVREAALPVTAAVVIAGLASLVLVAPIGLGMIVETWSGLLSFLGVAIGAIILVLAAVAVTNPMVRRIVDVNP
ncbi:hypothetical protein [Parenemella sanctibonifatiensis]|uniref:FtsX-like permease family protein n=1 Tax=Parenemella sanctibonifatiensis TaxID=2016505 RepID=A0A255EA55_9ACTN|nr:hypothetical protein [Parenemella sanctibonifatiensis]OYN87801.1 hypothetical protein CGZ92_05915 [Parenemella sanctibonifatiensis]